MLFLDGVYAEDTMWKGECFVFDERVTVNHDLNKGIYDQCNACRLPVIEADKKSEHFIEGVSCHDKHTPEQKARFTERQRQVELAKRRKEPIHRWRRRGNHSSA